MCKNRSNTARIHANCRRVVKPNEVKYVPLYWNEKTIILDYAFNSLLQWKVAGKAKIFEMANNFISFNIRFIDFTYSKDYLDISKISWFKSKEYKNWQTAPM